ncbi:hypothetical protein K1T71_010484 [Dendrolimus kikuchii]|uniref:Uncharacterized protein n=1 Tax=Dendrolimus kikuchii TaxID=765133 RepID=A0ACC1CRR1_9NEOP|nr:hypothetical protein K1T71_010484 [Dendrolimus kikuchii]
MKDLKMWWTYFFILLAPVNAEYDGVSGPPSNITSDPCTDKNHLFLAPGVFTAGGSNRACLSRFHPEGPARMILSLLTEDRKTVTVTRDLPPGDGGCVDLSAPQLPNTKAELIVNVRYPEAQCTWERRLTVRLSHGKVVLVHTEKAQYRPGDTLRIRVFSFKADLAPAQQNIDEIWIEGPRGVWDGSRVNQWTNLRTRLGLAQVQYQLDELAPPGKWSVKARLGDGSQGSTVFWVGNYELPPFQLSVRHAPRVLRTSERLVWTVCVRYPWTEAVEGMLVIRLRGSGSGEASGGIRTAVRLKAPRACHRHAAAARRIGLSSSHPPDVVVADFSFQEEGTRVWQNTTVVSQVVDKPITLEFLTKHRSVISPGLPYKLKVKATRWDDKPGTDQGVKVCRYPQSHAADVEQRQNSSCVTAKTDEAGVARVMFTASEDSSGFYRFEASLFNDSTTTAPPLTLPVRRSSQIHAALGPLKPDANAARTFVPLYLTLPNVTSAITVHFVVITRGGTIYRWGATTQCPVASTSNQVQTAPRYSKCDISNIAIYDNLTQNNFSNDFVDNDDETQTGDNIEVNRIIDYRTGRYVDSHTGSNRFTKDLVSTTTLARYQKNMARLEASLAKHTNLTQRITLSKRKGLKEANSTDFKVYGKSLDNDIRKKARMNNNLAKTRSKLPEKATNAVVNGINVSDTLLDRFLLRVMLPIKVTHQMCPDSHLIAYFYYNGELVSASKHFEMEECFSNKVEASWMSRQTLPGSITSIKVSTPGPALCALTVIDSATKWLKPSQSVKEVLMKGLKRLVDSHRNMTEYDAAGDCFLNTDSEDLPTNSLELTASWMAAAGIRVLGGDLPTARHCEPSPAPLAEDEGTVPRSDFSEAWLWRLVPVSSGGLAVASAKAPDSITRFEANAMCVSKAGVAISSPAILQVFRQFFIHADCPRRLRRGDTTIMRYRIFNYLYEPLSVQVQILTDAYLKGPEEVVQTICVNGRSSAARRVEIIAQNPGISRLIIRAVAVTDGHCANITKFKSGISDEVVIQVTIEPEGIPAQEHKSKLLCGTGITSPSEVFWEWPPVQVVPRTEALTVWVAGDITGPLLADADDLVQMPRGCGEQNMARLATNLLALNNLDKWSASAATARDHVARGYTRQLQYVHPSGGFSAFGPADTFSSTWLTAFALKYLLRAHQALWFGLPVPPVLERAQQWLLSQQMENGCFRNEGQVFHRELKGGMNDDTEISSIALTAYVITSLMESASPIPSRVLLNALPCLRALPPLKSKTPRVYAHALLAYALVSLVTSIEATGYALLALRHSHSALREDGYGAVRWLAAQRTGNGGFVATQDTLVALEALTAWSSLLPVPQSTINITAYSSEIKNSVRIYPGSKIPEVMKMGPSRELKIVVQGSGCVLVQATRAYNTFAPLDEETQKPLSIQLAVHTDGPFNCDDTNTTCFCAAALEMCVLWNGLFPEMALLEVTLPGGFGADATLLYSQLHKPNTLLRRIELASTNARATLYLSTKGGDTLGRAGHECFTVHAVGPKSKTRSAYVRVQDYYRPTVNDTQVYTIPEGCPSRISHETNEYIASDNIFEKARSVSESGEIEITHEFSFEDIPDGIPLEDPIYENLTNREKEDDKDVFEQNEYKVNDVINRNNSIDFSKVSNLVDKEVNNSNVTVTHNNEKKIETFSSNVESSEIVEKDDIKLINDDKTSKIINSSNRSTKLDEFKESNVDNKTSTQVTVAHFDNANLSKDNNVYDQVAMANVGQSATESVLFDKALNTKGNDGKVDHINTAQVEYVVNEDSQNNFADKLNNDDKLETTTISINNKKELADDHKGVENPKLSNFHILDSDKDTEFPTGIEGPIPAVVLPPPNFVPPNSVPPTYQTQERFDYGNYWVFDNGLRRYRRRYIDVNG